MNIIEDLIPEYLSSEYYLLSDPQLKEYAESLLHFFAQKSGNTPSTAKTSDTLKLMATLDVPLTVRKSVPKLLSEFFSFLNSTGRLGAATEWLACIARLEKEYLAGFRDDGTIKGQTIKNKGAEINRNDPCICGSGKKFKKCCMKIIT